MFNKKIRATAFALAAAALLLPTAGMAQNQDGLSMLAPENLSKPRPAAQFEQLLARPAGRSVLAFKPPGT